MPRTPSTSSALDEDNLSHDPSFLNFPLAQYPPFAQGYESTEYQPQLYPHHQQALPLGQAYTAYDPRPQQPYANQPQQYSSGDFLNNAFASSIPHTASLVEPYAYQYQAQYSLNQFDATPAQRQDHDSISPYELPSAQATSIAPSLPRLDTSERALQPAAAAVPPYFSQGGEGDMAAPTPPDATPQQPLTRNWVLPPKPKPGRKPALDTPPTKRKAQNRAAQRAFRERRAARVHELEAEAKEKRAEYEAQRDHMNAEHTKELDKLRLQLHESQKHNEEIGKRTEEMEKKIAEMGKVLEESQRKKDQSRHSSTDFPYLSRFSQSSGSISSGYRSSQGSIDALSPLSRRVPSLPDPGFGSRSSFPSSCKDCGTNRAQCDCIEKRLNSLPLPNQSNGSVSQPEKEVKQETNDEMEIDFTSQFAKPNGSSQQQAIDIDRDAPTISSPAGQGDYCGFCTDDTNCVCRANMGEDVMASLDMNIEMESNQPRKSTRPQPMEPSSGPTGPGTCDDCLQNPAKAAFCRTLASMPSLPTSSRNDSVTSPRSPLDASSPRNTPGDSISCSDTYDQLMQNPDFANNQNRDAYLRQLRPRQSPDLGPRSPSTGPIGGARPSAYEVEMASVLTAMNKPHGSNDGSRPTPGTSSSS